MELRSAVAALARVVIMASRGVSDEAHCAAIIVRVLVSALICELTEACAVEMDAGMLAAVDIRASMRLPTFSKRALSMAIEASNMLSTKPVSVSLDTSRPRLLDDCCAARLASELRCSIKLLTPPAVSPAPTLSATY